MSFVLLSGRIVTVNMSGIYLDYVKHTNDNGYIVDYFHCNIKGCNSNLQYPSVEDIQMAGFEQIVKCPAEWDWDVTPDKRKQLVTITNIKIIERELLSHIK